MKDTAMTGHRGTGGFDAEITCFLTAPNLIKELAASSAPLGALFEKRPREALVRSPPTILRPAAERAWYACAQCRPRLYRPPLSLLDQRRLRARV